MGKWWDDSDFTEQVIQDVAQQPDDRQEAIRDFRAGLAGYDPEDWGRSTQGQQASGGGQGFVPSDDWGRTTQLPERQYRIDREQAAEERAGFAPPVDERAEAIRDAHEGRRAPTITYNEWGVPQYGAPLPSESGVPERGALEQIGEAIDQTPVIGGLKAGLTGLARPITETVRNVADTSGELIDQMRRGDAQGVATAPLRFAQRTAQTAMETGGAYLNALGEPARAVERDVMGTYLNLANDYAKNPEQFTGVDPETGQGYALPAERTEIIKTLATLPDLERQDAIKNLKTIAYSPEANQIQALQDVKNGMTWEQAIKKNSSAWQEMAMQTILDPLNLLPVKAANAVFAPINKVFEAGLGLVGKGTTKVLSKIPLVAQAEKAKAATAFGDLAHGALGEFFGSKQATEDWAAKIGRAMTGEFDATLSDAARKTLSDIMPAIKADVFKGKGETGDVLQAVLKKYDPLGAGKFLDEVTPENVARAFQKAAINGKRAELGLAPIDTKPGVLSRSLDYIGSLLKEEWLSNPIFSTAYILTNTPSDFLRAAFTGHFLNPLDFGAAQKVAGYMRSLGQDVPRTIDRTLFGTVLSGAEKATDVTGQRYVGAASKLPVPLVGKPESFANFLRDFVGFDLANKVGGKARDIFSSAGAESTDPLVRFARGFNIGTAREKWGQLSNGLERNARVTMFYNEVKNTLPSVREAIAKAIQEDANIPQVIRNEWAGKLRGFQIQKPEDFVTLARELTSKTAPTAKLFDYHPTQAIPEESTKFFGEVADALKGLKRIDANEVQGVFKQALSRAEMAFRQANKAVSEATTKAQVQATAEAAAAVVGKDKGLLPRLTAKLDEIRKGYGAITDGNLRRAEALLLGGFKEGAAPAADRVRRNFLNKEITGAKPTSTNISDWSNEVKAAYETWVRGKLYAKGKPFPGAIDPSQVQNEVAQIQDAAAAIWRNLNANKYAGNVKSERMRGLLDADKLIWELTDGARGLDMSKFGEVVATTAKPVTQAVEQAKKPASKFVESMTRPTGAPATAATMTAERAAQMEGARPLFEGVQAGTRQVKDPTFGYQQYTDEALAGIRQVLDDWQKQVLDRLAQPAQAPTAQLPQGVADKYSKMMANEYRRVIDQATRATNDLLFDYGVRGGLEQLIGTVSPFYKYQISIVPWAIRELGQRPALLATAGRYETASAKDVEQQELPPRFKGTMPVPRSVSDTMANVWNATAGRVFGETPVGVDYRVNPKNLLAFMYGGQTTEKRDEYYKVSEQNGKGVVSDRYGTVLKELPNLDSARQWAKDQERGFGDDTPQYVRVLREVVDGMQALGMRPYPYIQIPLYKLGVYGDQQPSDILKETPAIRAATGGKVDIEKGLREFQTNGAENKILGYYTAIEIAKQVQGGTLSKERAMRAFADRNNPDYQAAQAKAQNSADVRSLLRDIIPMTLRAVDPGEMALRKEQEVLGVLFDVAEQARKDNDPERIKAAQKAINEFYKNNPEMEAFGMKSKAADEQTARATTTLKFGEYDTAKAQADQQLADLKTKYEQDLAKFPVGYKGADLDALNAEYKRRQDAIYKSIPPYPGESKPRTLTAPEQQEAQVRSLSKSEPRSKDFKTYAEYQKAHAQWEQSIGEKGRDTTLEDVRAYNRRNDTVRQAAESAWFDQYYNPLQADLAAVREKFSGKERALEERKVLAKYGDPDAKKFADWIKQTYGDRWTDEQLKTELAKLKTITADERRLAGLDEGGKLVDSAYSELAKVPPGKSDTFWTAVANELNKTLKAEAGTGKYYSKTAEQLQEVWYSGKPEEIKYLGQLVAAIQKATTQLKYAAPTDAVLTEWVQAEKDIAEYYKIPETDKAARKEFWNAHPLLAKYYSSDKQTSTTQPSTPNIRTGGGGGGGYASGGYRPSTGFVPSPRPDNTAMWKDVAGTLDAELLPLVQSFLRLPEAYRAVFANQYPKLMAWLKGKDIGWLAALAKSYMSALPRQPQGFVPPVTKLYPGTMKG